MIARINEILKFKEMIKSWTRKELRTRYKGSFLGFLWTFMNPLLQLIVYSIIFPFVMKFSQENYATFLFVAIIPWNFFTTCLQGSCGIIILNSNLVTKVYFPREVLPISFTFSGLMNMIFSYAIVFPMMAIFKVPFTWNLLWLPILMFFQTIMCTGIAMLISSINVYFRDIEHFISVAVMAMYFLTPIMYDITALPEGIRKYLFLNPMTGYIMMYRDVTFYGCGVDLKVLLLSIIYSFIILAFGAFTFEKLQRRFTEVL